jgi:hypothetical protein
MRATVRLLPLTLLLLPLPARAQSRHVSVSTGETYISESHDGRTLEVRSRGEVEFNDEGDWVTWMAPGSELVVRESDGGRDRRVEFSPDGDGVRVRYRVGGDERPLDAEGREWARRVIRGATRESGLGAARRVARIRQRSGVAGVLADMASLRTDTGRRLYYVALLDSGPMSDAEYARVLDDVGARVGSATERRLVLTHAVDRVRGGRGLEALVRATRGMESDTEVRLVLTDVAERQRLAHPGVRDAFFRAVEAMDSDTERRLVLTSVLEHETLADAGLREAFFHAAGGIDSGTERRLVLSDALQHDASETVAVDALGAAESIDSDTEKRLVLTSVPASLRRSARVIEAYRRVVGRIQSDTQRRLALTWLLEGGR